MSCLFCLSLSVGFVLEFSTFGPTVFIGPPYLPGPALSSIQTQHISSYGTHDWSLSVLGEHLMHKPAGGRRKTKTQELIQRPIEASCINLAKTTKHAKVEATTPTPTATKVAARCATIGNKGNQKGLIEQRWTIPRIRQRRVQCSPHQGALHPTKLSMIWMKEEVSSAVGPNCPAQQHSKRGATSSQHSPTHRLLRLP